MHRLELLQWVAKLGAAFVKRGMDRHALNLRVYYLAVQRGLAPANKLDLHCSEAFVIEWMKTLRVPPFHSSYECRARGSACSRCGRRLGAEPSVCTDCVFPGGARMRCQSCGSVWLEPQ